MLRRAIKGFLILFAVFVAYTLIRLGYEQSWTGFGFAKTGEGQVREAKTLWDWMDLFIVPLVLAGAAYWLNRQERKAERRLAEQRAQTEREIATDRYQQAALEAYLDAMTKLLLENHLRTSEPNSQVRDVARARTLTVLGGLDGARKGMVLRFLKESDLVSRKDAVISLCGANLSGADLSGAELSQVDLSGANLNAADLSGAFLIQASLGVVQQADIIFTETTEQGEVKRVGRSSRAMFTRLAGANLSGALLTEADLVFADLTQADLRGANLCRADLGAARLVGADLEGADLRDAKIPNHKEAKSLRGATMPDGTKGD